MAEPLFPIRPTVSEAATTVLAVEPYQHEGAWVFDDRAAGLEREPFVGGVSEMIDRLVMGIAEAGRGFRLQFAPFPFEGFQSVLTWIRADPVEGNWYRTDVDGSEGWLCPALFCYFPVAPQKIYVRAEPRQNVQH